MVFKMRKGVIGDEIELRVVLQVGMVQEHFDSLQVKPVLYELAPLALLFVQLSYILGLELPPDIFFEFFSELFEKGFAFS